MFGEQLRYIGPAGSAELAASLATSSPSEQTDRQTPNLLSNWKGKICRGEEGRQGVKQLKLLVRSGEEVAPERVEVFSWERPT